MIFCSGDQLGVRRRDLVLRRRLGWWGSRVVASEYVVAIISMGSVSVVLANVSLTALVSAATILFVLVSAAAYMVVSAKLAAAGVSMRVMVCFSDKDG